MDATKEIDEALEKYRDDPEKFVKWVASQIKSLTEGVTGTRKSMAEYAKFNNGKVADLEERIAK